MAEGDGEEPAPPSDGDLPEPIPYGDVPEPPPGTGVERASALSRRTFIALIAALFLFGSCGVALGLYRLSRGDGDDPAPTPPPTPGPTSSPSPSATGTPSASPTGEPAPDLVISELTSISVTATNVGTGRAGRFVVSAAGKAFVVEDGLEPNASARFTFACREGPLTAVADATGRVEESDEDNNTRTEGPFDCGSSSPSVSPTGSPTGTTTTPPPTALPDLIVREVSFDQVTVANVGGAGAGQFVVDVGQAGSFTVGGLGVGESATLTYRCTSGTIVAIVDVTDRVEESNERNNSRGGGPFQCLADLTVSTLGIDSVTIANVGVGDAGPSFVAVSGFTANVPPIPSGQRVTVDYPCVGGTVTAIADIQQQVQESNEDNNQHTEDVGPCPVPIPPSAIDGGPGWPAWIRTRTN